MADIIVKIYPVIDISHHQCGSAVSVADNHVQIVKLEIRLISIKDNGHLGMSYPSFVNAE